MSEVDMIQEAMIQDELTSLCTALAQAVEALEESATGVSTIDGRCYRGCIREFGFHTAPCLKVRTTLAAVRRVLGEKKQ